MALSGNIERKFAGPGGSSGWYIGIDWTVNNQSAASNSSNVTASLYLRTSGSGYTIVSNPAKNVSLSIDGSNAGSSSTVGMGANAKKVLYTRTINVGHDGNGNKTCAFSASATVGLTLSGTYYGTISVSGNGTFNQINLNSAPWWTSDDTRMENIRSHAIIPENWNAVAIDSSTANDSEQGGNLNYDIHRYINNGYSAQVKWGGSELRVTDYIGNWGQGTRFKWEARVHDGHGLWASGSRWSWEYTKNTFTRASVDTISSIGPTSTNLTFTARTARNSGGGNGYVNTDFGYRIESLTSGVGIHGNPGHSENAHRDVGFILGIEKDGVNPGNPHYLKYDEIKRAVAGNGYKGNIRLRLVSWNSYGSSGSYDFDVWVDLRVNPEYTKIRYHQDSYITHGSTNYYIPAHIPFKVEWDHVADPLAGGNCSYDVYYQIGTRDWVHLGATSSNSYTAYLGSTAIGNNKTNDFQFIIRAKTSYGNYSDTGAPSRITLWDYAAPTVTVTSVTRNKDNVVINGSLRINSSIPSADFNTCHYRWSSGGPNTNNIMFNKPSGTAYTRSFTLTISANQNVSGAIHIATSDTIRDKLVAKLGESIGLWGSTDVNIKAYMPVMSLTKKGLGINMRPNDSNYKFMVDGNAKIFGNVEADNISSAGPNNTWITGLNPTVQGWKTGFQSNTDEGFKIGMNGLSVYNNANNGVVTITRRDDGGAPNGTGKTIEIKCTGAAAPGFGGFTYTYLTSRAKIITFIFTAKIPTDRYLVHAHNALGEGSAQKWLTSNKGTGKWTEYAFQIQCGDSGSFSTAGFFYLDGGPTPSTSSALVWYLARATAYENSVASVNVSIKSDGVMETGRYIDFHDDIASGTDYSVRIDGGGTGPHGETKTLLISNASGGLRIGCQNSAYAHFTTDRGAFYFDQRVEFANTITVKKGSEGHWNYSQIYFPAQANDPGRILHYESNNTSQLWLMPGDDNAASDEVIIGSINKTDMNFADAAWNYAIRLRTDGHIAANGGITVNNGWQVPRSAAHDGYWGIHNPECQTGNYLRTPDPGLIPAWANGEGQSSLGTSGWPFERVVSRKYSPPSHGWTRFEDLYKMEFLIRNCATHAVLEAGWVNDHNHNDPYWRPDAAGHGLIGTSGHRWYVGYFHGGSFNSNRELKHDISKMDNEVLYNYIKEINTYTYRTIAGDKENEETYRERNDLFLGSMIDELPTEIVMYDTEHGDGKSVEIYSYATMIAGGLKHAIKIIEQQGETIETLQYKIQDLEEKINGVN